LSFLEIFFEIKGKICNINSNKNIEKRTSIQTDNKKYVIFLKFMFNIIF